MLRILISSQMFTMVDDLANETNLQIVTCYLFLRIQVTLTYHNTFTKHVNITTPVQMFLYTSFPPKVSFSPST